MLVLKQTEHRGIIEEQGMQVVGVDKVYEIWQLMHEFSSLHCEQKGITV